MRSKSRMVAVLASVCVCAAMVGTGFASWVILDTQTGTATGNVTAEEVSDEGIELDVSTPSEAKIIFGSPETMTNSNAWLVESEATGQGKLSVDITVKVKGKVGSFTIDYAHAGDGFEEAATNHLVVLYPTYSIKSVSGSKTLTTTDNIGIDQSTNNGKATLSFGTSAKTPGYDFTEVTTFVVTATFNWGTAFGSQNPYNFFNEKSKDAAASDWSIDANTVGTPEEGASATWGAVAKGVLTWMNTNFDDTTYTFTFTASQSK